MPPSTGSATQISSEIHRHLTSKHIPPTPQWLQAFMSSVRLTTPILALQNTALFRLLQTDITASIQSSPSSTFPAGISNPDVKELRLAGPIPVQVLDVEDIGRSRWSQVEAIEMEERGETRKGHEVVRVVADDEDGSGLNLSANANGGPAPAGPHKILVQDGKGVKVYAFEMERVEGVDVGMAIGSKIVLRDAVVARGVVLLTGRDTEVLGGKVDAWDKKWRTDRKGVLKEKAGWREGMGL